VRHIRRPGIRHGYREDLVRAGRECGDADSTCLFPAHSATKPTPPNLKNSQGQRAQSTHERRFAHAADLKNTGKGNLFVIFGEPDIDILNADDNQVRVKINGIDVFHPNTGEVRSDGADGIACWFIDTDYNEESFL